MEIHKIMNKSDYRILNIGIPKIRSGMVVSGFMIRPANGSEITYCIPYSKVLNMASGTPKPDGSKISNPWIINGSR